MANTHSKFPIILTAFMLLALVVLIMLGNWQRERLAWKEALLQTISERMQQPPRKIDEIVKIYNQSQDVAYWPVTLKGQFLHDKEQHYFATYKGASGYFIYTPVQLSGRDIYIFVNRGFVTFDKKNVETRQEGQIKGEVSIQGLSRNAPEAKPSSVMPDNDLAQNIYYWQDITNMAAQTGITAMGELLPFFMDADNATNPGGWPIGGVTQVELPNNHLQYMITWYGIALTLLGVYVAYIIQWRRKKSA